MLHLTFSLNSQNHCRWCFLLYSKISSEVLGPVSEAINTTVMPPFFFFNSHRLHKDKPLISFVFIIIIYHYTCIYHYITYNGIIETIRFD